MSHDGPVVAVIEPVGRRLRAVSAPARGPDRDDRGLRGRLRHADLGAAVELRDLRLRHGHLRPGHLAAVPVQGPLHDRARPGLLRPPRQRDHVPLRAVLLAGRRARTSSTSSRPCGWPSARSPSGCWPATGSRTRGSPSALAAAYLLYPSLEWINWWHFHPDALAITPLLFAYWLATERRWGWFAVAVGLRCAARRTPRSRS